jgi:hypothetical protein
MRNPAFSACGVGLVLLAGCSRNAPPPAVNSEMARSYETASKALTPNQQNTDEAVKTLAGARSKDPDNAMTAYLFAAALAKRKDWEGVSREIKAGNQAPHSVYYVDDSPFRVMRGLSTIRDLTRAVAAAAPALGVDKGADLLREVRAMGKKIAGTEPAGVVPVTGGGVVRQVADKALVSLYEKAGRASDADLARRLLSADKAWLDQVLAGAKAIEAKTDPSTLIRKHFTQEEWREYDNSRKVTPPVKAKLDAIKAEIDAIERPFAQKHLKSMPD